MTPQPHHEIITVGETLGLIRPLTPGRLRHSSGATLGIGGAESNVAIGVTRLGHPAAWVGRVGADPWGELILDELRAEGVDVSRALIDPERTTGLMLKHRQLDGSTNVTYSRRDSAGSALRPEDIPADFIACGRILHLSGITPALSASAKAAIERAVEVAREAGLKVSVDLNYRKRLWGDRNAAPILTGLLARADIAFAGEEEASLLIDATGPEQACEGLAALGPKHVILKRGSRGAVALIEGELLNVEPSHLASPVDPVGAGDAFAAGYLVGVLEQLPAAVALALGARVGAFAVTGTGDWESVPYRTMVDGGLGLHEKVDR
jgi:2-dehydro-3-deoxygluconokinase